MGWQDNVSWEEQQASREQKREEVAYDLFVKATASGVYRGPSQDIAFIDQNNGLQPGKKPFWQIRLTIPSHVELVIRVYGDTFFLVQKNGRWLDQPIKSREKMEEFLQAQYPVDQ